MLRSTEVVWTDVFRESGKTYQPPKLVLFSGSWPTACGRGQAAMGPFYCPNDQKVYIDLRFYKVLEQKLGAPGQFAQAYVVAHEVGHHVQQQLGIMDKVDAMRGRGGEAQANALSVRVELQADCFAGVWAARSQKEQGWRLDPGDIETALNAAAQIGDDTLAAEDAGHRRARRPSRTAPARNASTGSSAASKAAASTAAIPSKDAISRDRLSARVPRSSRSAARRGDAGGGAARHRRRAGRAGRRR